MVRRIARKKVQKKSARKRNSRKSVRERRSMWEESVGYIKESRGYIYAIILMFVISAVIGFFWLTEIGFIEELLAELALQVETLGHGALIWFIFQNNLGSAFASMLFGIVLGVVPAFNALANGFILGYVFDRAAAVGGLGVIWYLVPHGIFELPAIFISLGLGVKMGTFIFAKKGNRIKEFRRRFWSSLKVFLTVVLPLLIIAAIIEGSFIAFSG